MDINAVNAEYIDINDALKRIGGSMDLYKRLLKRFVDGTQVAELGTAFQEGNKDEASRLAHTVKGVAANLSLIKLRDISAELEQIIKSDSDHTAKLAEFDLVYAETAKMIAEITG